jgi:hypothetical protein
MPTVKRSGSAVKGVIEKSAMPSIVMPGANLVPSPQPNSLKLPRMWVGGFKLQVQHFRNRR